MGPMLKKFGKLKRIFCLESSRINAYFLLTMRRFELQIAGAKKMLLKRRRRTVFF